jgi:hypothetical protein
VFIERRPDVLLIPPIVFFYDPFRCLPSKLVNQIADQLHQDIVPRPFSLNLVASQESLDYWF